MWQQEPQHLQALYIVPLRGADNPHRPLVAVNFHGLLSTLGDLEKSDRHECLYILAPQDSTITQLTDLTNQRVSLGTAGSGIHFKKSTRKAPGQWPRLLLTMRKLESIDHPSLG